MVRLGLLSLIMIMSPTPTGIWVKSSGEEIEAPCPLELVAGAPARLPRGCEAPRAGVLISRDHYVESQGELEALTAEVSALRAQLTETRRAREAAEAELLSALQIHEHDLNLLKVTCTTQTCPQFKPAAIGAAITLSACAAAFTTYHFTR